MGTVTDTPVGEEMGVGMEMGTVGGTWMGTDVDTAADLEKGGGKEKGKHAEMRPFLCALSAPFAALTYCYPPGDT